MSTTPRQTSQGPLLLLAMTFVAVLIASNVIASKLTQLSLPMWALLGRWAGRAVQVDCALFLFPLTYVISDMINEIYGFKTSRKVIWGGMACTVAFSILVYWSILMKPSPYWEHQEAYALTLYGSMRVFFASMVAYFFGEFLNALAFDRIRKKTGERLFVARALASTFLGNIVDTSLFCVIAFLKNIPPTELTAMILINVFLKSSVELALMPFILKLIAYCKREEMIVKPAY